MTQHFLLSAAARTLSLKTIHTEGEEAQRPDRVFARDLAPALCARGVGSFPSGDTRSLHILHREVDEGTYLARQNAALEIDRTDRSVIHLETLQQRDQPPCL